MDRRERLKRCYACEETDRPGVYSGTLFPLGDPGYDRPLMDMVHNAGGYVHVHCHGSVKKVLRHFLEMDVDVLHPFEAPPMGDITPSEAKERIRGRMCFEGNIPIHLMCEADPDDIRRMTEKLIEEVFDDCRGLIVSPTASPYIRGRGEECFPRFKAMIDAVLSVNG